VGSEGEPAGERVSWQRLRERILARDGHRCGNCTSDKYLEIHHWQPVAEESSGVDVRGYSTGPDPRLVPESGLVTLCQICHSALTEARKIVRLSKDSSLLGHISVPERDWHKIFELWELNGRQLPMKVVRESWNQTAAHYILVERIEIRRWPYGFAWSRYCRNGETAEQQKIGSAGSYQWRKV
jgi:hypothetical protein